MKIASLNKLESRVNFQDEIKSMYVNTILAEHNFIASIISHEILVYTERGILNVKSLLNQFHKYMPNRTQFLESLKTIENHEKIYQKLSKTKYHDKRTLEFINRHKNNVSILNKRFGDYLEERLKHFKIWELIEFKKEPDWELVLPLYEYDQTHESIYIQAMEQAVPSCEYILSFDNVVEQLFSWSDFDKINLQAFEFIKIPLWDFPMVNDLTFIQLKYTRADLKLMLEQFYIKFYDCLRQLFAMPF